MLSFLKSKTIWAAFLVALLPYADVITGVTTGMEYKLALSYADPIANSYSATITYTATNP